MNISRYPAKLARNVFRRLIQLAKQGSCARNRWRGRLVRHGGMRHDLLADEGDTVVHCGIFRTATIDKWLRAIGTKGRLIAIEAEPSNFRQLFDYVSANSLDNVMVIHSAVWREAANVTLQASFNPHFNKLKDSETHGAVEEGANFEEYTVLAKTLDSILVDSGIKHVDLVMLTISGAEYEALDGMVNTLEQPGIRLFARSILLGEDGKPLYPKVAAKLNSMGLRTFHGGPEKNPPREGCNVFAFRPK